MSEIFHRRRRRRGPAPGRRAGRAGQRAPAPPGAWIGGGRRLITSG